MLKKISPIQMMLITNVHLLRETMFRETKKAETAEP